MGDLAISVRGLGKRYTLTAGGPRAGYQTLRDSLVSAVRRPFRRAAAGEDFWALSDVSFEVNRGEVVGVIGRNGAGKSTLLKVLSRITEPTAGEVDIYGRVGSLLEVGTGFHAELSGRENIYLNGSILGMRRAEIAKQFDAMVAFAEVERFIDTPVKFYSSGMYTRLAFAVAAHLEPEILIVDEVLAVGDVEFQKKCLGKMGEVARAGRTVLFVSHNIPTMQTLCTRGVLLVEGKVSCQGAIVDVVREYVTKGDDNSYTAAWTSPQGSQGVVDLTAVRVRLANGEINPHIPAEMAFDVEIEYRVRDRATFQLAFRLNRDDEQTVLTTADGDAGFVLYSPREPGVYLSSVRIPGRFLTPGDYHLLVAVNQRDQSLIILPQLLRLEVGKTGSLQQLDGRLGGVVPTLPWQTRRLSEQTEGVGQS